jgi:hypothetical protein
MLRHRHRLDPWCSGPTCQPVTLEIAGSNPVGSATTLFPTPRPPARTGRSSFLRCLPGVQDPLWQNRLVKTRQLLSALGVFAVAVALTVAALLAAPLLGPASQLSNAPLPAASAPPSSSSAAASTGSSPSAPSRSATVTASAAPSGLADLVEVAIVPVTNFRATPTSTNLREVTTVLAGTSARYQALELVATEADAILAELGVARPSEPGRLILVPDAAALAADLT